MRSPTSKMRLKRVQITGFKTFAEKTVLDLDGDFTAVIGPNGCGKSNIVDAILWGLGEPNARTLRAQTGQDVIFSGSATRKPVGFAEVTLTFDNEDGTLAIETPEVSVTRRLSRSGDSDYSINKRPCRQRDLFELFADSGLGRAGYAIVGQKEIDAALAASPEDRRAWIDEAAGVQRYRSRRIEATRRLDQARLHLERINDIVVEIEAQREPLRKEAETAKRYKTVTQELRQIESGLMIVELVEAIEATSTLESRIATSAETAEKERIEAARLLRESGLLGEKIDAIEQEIDVVRGLQQGTITALERAEGNIRLAQQRLDSLDDFEKNLGEESEAGKHRLEQAQADLIEAQIEFAELEQLCLESQEASGTASARVKELDARLAAAEKSLAAARLSQSERIRIEAENSARVQRLRLIARELKGIEETTPPLEAGIAEAQATLDSLNAKFQEVTDANKAVAEKRLEAQRGLEQHAGVMRTLLAEMASLEAKQRGIASTIELHEGLSNGSRAVLDLVQSRRLEDKYTAVGEAFSVNTELALAIEIGLGAAVHDLITPHDSDAKRAIEILKRERLGRATFQPINLVRSNPRSPELSQLARRPGVLGVAADLVKVDSQFQQVIEGLLGRTLITETLDHALALSGTRGWSKAVSLEGEVVHAGGAVTGGNSQRQTTGLVQRHAELAAATKRLEELNNKRTELLAQQQKFEAIAEELDQTLAAPELEAERAELEETQTWLASLKQELHSATRERDKLLAEQQELTAASQAATAEPIDTEAVEAERNQLLIEIGSLSGEAQQLIDQRRSLEARLSQSKIRVEESTRRVQFAEQSEQKRDARFGTLDEQRLAARTELEQHGLAKEEAVAKQADFSARLENTQAEKAKLLEASFALSEQAKQAQRNVQVAEDLGHRAELERAKLDARRASTLERLLEEYGVTQEAAIEQAPGIQLPEDAASEVHRLRKEAKGFGEVNLGAIEAFERLTERYEELSAQQDDVLSGKAEVEAGIKELDGLTRDRFMSTFERLQLAFAETFQKMFGGGEATLRLNNPEDVLATGVDVEVTIPGKRRQRLELLSGGERAMSACAFLFAILRVKPSPLVILDEVDAPLDGRNVERFIEMLQDASDQIQFIVITHNPVTIEAAPTWFGVTMESGSGVTTVLPYRVPPSLLEHVVHDTQLKPVGV